MTAYLSPYPVFRSFDVLGFPLAGGLLYTYVAGTSTPQATFTDSTGSVSNTNPVILDASGQANVWLGDGLSYKLVLKDAFGVTQWTVDNVSSQGASILNDLANTSDIAKGDALVGVKQPYTGAVGRNQHLKNAECISVTDFGAVGDYGLVVTPTDNTSAINSAIAAMSQGGTGGVIYFPRGNYLVTSTIYVPIGIFLVGDGFFCGVRWNGTDTIKQGSCIVGMHTGPAIVSFKGAYAGGMYNMSVFGHQTVTPKTGVCCGRSTGASAGRHLFERVNVTGSYSVAAWYLIASEENTYVQVHGNVLGGTAKYTMYISGQDDFSVDSLVSSSNWNANIITGFNLLHQAGTANCAAIYINVRLGTAGWLFKGGFTGLTSGANSSHIVINLADNGAESTDFVFEDVGNESASNSTPPINHYLVSRDSGVPSAVLNGLVIRNCTPGQFLGGTQYYIYCQDNTTISGADIYETLSKYPSRFYGLTTSKVSLPSQKMIVDGPCSKNQISALKVFSYYSAGNYISNLTLCPCLYDFGYTGVGLNDMTVSQTTNYTGIQSRDLLVQIDGSTSPNTFKWSLDGGASFLGTLVPITAGVDQTLTEGIVIRFATGTGHSDTPGDRWSCKIDPTTLPNLGARWLATQAIASSYTGGIKGLDDTSYLQIAASSTAAGGCTMQLSGNNRTGANGNFDIYNGGRFSVNSFNGGTTYLVVDKVSPATRSGRDNVDNLGSASFRWNTVFAGNGSINTSDGRCKQQIDVISDQEKKVASKLKQLIRKFKFNDSVASKKESARIHVGIIAQDVEEAFKSEGLNAHDYGMFCYDSWEAQERVVADNGSIIQQDHPAGDRYGIRYDQLHSFILAAL